MSNLKISFTEEELEEFYTDFNENHMNKASEDIRTSYSAMHRAFEDYLNAIQDDLFQQVFQFGYMKGVQNGN